MITAREIDMPSIPLASGPYGKMPPGGLAALFNVIGQPAVPQTNGIVISPRSSSAAPWLQFQELARAGYDPEAFTRAFLKVDARIDPLARLSRDGLDNARASVQRWLQKGDFGQIAAKALETSSPDMRHLWLRETVLPQFFAAYPNGRFACITYDEQLNRYLALLNTLKKSQTLNSSDPSVLTKYAARSIMTSFGLNVPAEMIWLMLSVASVAFFPDAYVFGASGFCVGQEVRQASRWTA